MLNARNNSELKAVAKTRYLEYSGYKNKQIKKKNFMNGVTGWTFTMMPVIIMTVFVFSAFIIGLTYLGISGALTPDGSSFKPSSVSDNWRKLMDNDLFPKAIKNTLIFTGIMLGVVILTALVFSSLLNLSRPVGKKVFTAIYFLPQLTSDVAATIVFVNLFGKSFDIYANPANAFWIVVLAGMWIHTASTLVTFNTAFANIGKTEYEAASLDGANAWVKFWKITIPALAPILAFQLIQSSIFGMTAFGQSYIMISLDVAGLSGHPEHVILWPVLGFLKITGSSHGVVANTGVGLFVLSLLGCGVFVLSMLANIIQPVKGRK